MHPSSTVATVDSAYPPQIVAIIPARFASTRFPGKALVDIDGQPMIEHVYRRARAAATISRVIVATDDLRIATRVAEFGGHVRLTRPTHLSGTDRIAEIAETLDCDIIVNVQGDEPLIDPRAIDQAVAPLVADPSVPMTTLYRRIAQSAELDDPNVVKVVLDRAGFALYFSRGPRSRTCATPRADGRRSTGTSASTPTAAARCSCWRTLEPTPLERAESLEQLRALEHGIRIKAVETAYDSISVDTPRDLEEVRRLLAAPASG